MTGSDLKGARLNADWTQEQTAAKLGLTQAYLSMVESGRRAVSAALGRKAMGVFRLPPTALPLRAEGEVRLGEGEMKANLGALGYPGFGYLRGRPKCNPVQLLFHALNQPSLDARVVEALPWLAHRYADREWEWLVRNVKLRDRQNRLGFVLGVAGELAERSGERARQRALLECKAEMERSRLMAEDTLCNDGMTEAERKWLRQHRSAEAKHWNLLTDLEARHLEYA